MNLTAEQISNNWDKLISYIDEYISSPRKEKLKAFYEKYSERISLMPASHLDKYHNAFPSGYLDHILRVIECSLKLHKIWEETGADTSTYTIEELVFSALNHDLGKMGDHENESYLPQTDNWRKEKLGEDYMFNTKLPFASVPDRGLFLLQDNDIKYTFNEMVAIQTHDGLYDEGNKKYLFTYLPEQKPRTSLPFIIHQADLMASRIEWEMLWLPKLKIDKPEVKPTKAKQPIKMKTLSKVGSNGLNSVMNNFFNKDDSSD